MRITEASANQPLAFKQSILTIRSLPPRIVSHVVISGHLFEFWPELTTCPVSKPNTFGRRVGRVHESYMVVIGRTDLGYIQITQYVYNHFEIPRI